MNYGLGMVQTYVLFNINEHNHIVLKVFEDYEDFRKFKNSNPDWCEADGFKLDLHYANKEEDLWKNRP